MLFDAHTRSFQALGGVAQARHLRQHEARRWTRSRSGKGRTRQRTLLRPCAATTCLTPDFCNVASGWEKGVVEKNVQDSRRRIWIEAASRRFGSFMPNSMLWLGERCRSVWSRHRASNPQAVHGGRDAGTWRSPHLMSMPVLFDGYVEKPGKGEQHLSGGGAARNRYSVPCEWAGHLVSTRVCTPTGWTCGDCAQTLSLPAMPALPGSGQSHL